MSRRVYYARRFPAPRPAPPPDPGAQAEAAFEAALDRINRLSPMMRTNWFGLLAFLIFVGVTLLSVSDADFFLERRRTSLPLVNVSIPTRSFFTFAPVLSAALYVYFHFQLLKLWDAMQDALRAGRLQTLRQRAFPWLVNDLAFALAEGPATRHRPMHGLAGLVTRLLVWAAGPIVLAYAWWRSMTAHEEVLTLLIALTLGLALYAGFTSWWVLRARVAEDREPGRVWTLPRRAVALLAGLLIIALSWLRTEGGLERYVVLVVDYLQSELDHEVRIDRDALDPDCAPPGAGRRIQVECWAASVALTTEDLRPSALPLGLHRLFTLAPIDLSGARLTPLPDAWRDHEIARARFRAAWCRRLGHAAETCIFTPDGLSPPPALIKLRRRVCTEEARVDPECLEAFEAMDDAFAEEWRTERFADVTLQGGPNLAGLDLRGANLAGAYIGPADFTGARLQGADFTRARAEGATFVEARLDRAVLHRLHAEAADFSDIVARDADFSGVRFEGAVMRRARLSGANLSRARLQGADLRRVVFDDARMIGARLHGADMRRARFTRADLSRAMLDGADLRAARFDGTLLDARPSPGAALRQADFSTARMENMDLLRLGIGDASVKLPRGSGLAAGEGELAHWQPVRLGHRPFIYRWRGWREANGLPWPAPGSAMAFFRNLNILSIPPQAPVLPEEIEDGSGDDPSDEDEQDEADDR